MFVREVRFGHGHRHIRELGEGSSEAQYATGAVASGPGGTAKKKTALYTRGVASSVILPDRVGYQFVQFSSVRRTGQSASVQFV